MVVVVVVLVWDLMRGGVGIWIMVICGGKGREIHHQWWW